MINPSPYSLALSSLLIYLIIDMSIFDKAFSLSPGFSQKDAMQHPSEVLYSGKDRVSLFPLHRISS